MFLQLSTNLSLSLSLGRSVIAVLIKQVSLSNKPKYLLPNPLATFAHFSRILGSLLNCTFFLNMPLLYLKQPKGI